MMMICNTLVLCLNVIRHDPFDRPYRSVHDDNNCSWKVKCNGMFLYSAVSSPFDRSKRFTLHALSELFITTPNRLMLEAF